MFPNARKCNTTKAICRAKCNLTDKADIVQNNTIEKKTLFNKIKRFEVIRRMATLHKMQRSFGRLNWINK